MFYRFKIPTEGITITSETADYSLQIEYGYQRFSFILNLEGEGFYRYPIFESSTYEDKNYYFHSRILNIVVNDEKEILERDRNINWQNFMKPIIKSLNIYIRTVRNYGSSYDLFEINPVKRTNYAILIYNWKGEYSND